MYKAKQLFMKVWDKNNICEWWGSGLWVLVVALLFSTPVFSQKVDKQLFQQFEARFSLLDSLIFKQQDSLQNSSRQLADPFSKIPRNAVDSLIYEKVNQQMDEMMSETGLLISGQSYYRLDEGFGIDDEDALSRYTAKAQVELRWNFLSSSLVRRQSRLQALGIQGELERVSFEQEHIRELIEKQKDLFRVEYDSLLAGVIQLRIDNLNLLSDAQEYLVSDRSISTDELLKIMDEKAIAERHLVTIPQKYPLARQLVYPKGAVIEIDTASLKKHIIENGLMLQKAGLEIELLQQQEKAATYWRTLNISPFIRYSYYVRPEMKNSANVDAGVAFQIPLSSQESHKQKVLRAERVQKVMEKDVLEEMVIGKINALFMEIDRANRGLQGELERIQKLRRYLEIRKENYQGHIGEYNFLSRIKEYNHYLTCWENYYSYQYTRDCSIAELQYYVYGSSVLNFCTIIK